MGAELLPRFAPVPSSVAELAKRLPAGERARLEWFPGALRTELIDPLVQARGDEFHARVDDRLVGAVRIVLRLAGELSAMRELPDVEGAVRALEQEEPRHAWHELVQRRLEASDVVAADDLREAYEWLRAILSAISITALDGAARSPNGLQLGAISDSAIWPALVGEVRAFLRGLLLTVGALDVLERDRVPPTIGVWCRLALDELHATARALRATGVPVPGDVQIPGYEPAAWRDRRAAQEARRSSILFFELSPRAGACPPGVIERIVEVLHPEQIWLFGSRARGTAGPESDWDLLVVVPDATTLPLDDESWRALRDVRRHRVELVPMRRTEFELDRREFGALAYVASTTGRLVYGR